MISSPFLVATSRQLPKFEVLISSYYAASSHLPTCFSNRPGMHSKPIAAEVKSSSQVMKNRTSIVVIRCCSSYSAAGCKRTYLASSLQPRPSQNGLLRRSTDIYTRGIGQCAKQRTKCEQFKKHLSIIWASCVRHRRFQPYPCVLRVGRPATRI